MTIRTEAPAGANVLDIDAARAARAEARADSGGTFLKLDAGYVEVKAEVPLAAMDDFQSGEITRGLTALFADPADVPTVVASGLTTDDVSEILKFITGVDLGESSASSAS